MLVKAFRHTCFRDVPQNKEMVIYAHTLLDEAKGTVCLGTHPCPRTAPSAPCPRTDAGANSQVSVGDGLSVFEVKGRRLFIVLFNFARKITRNDCVMKNSDCLKFYDE